MKEGLKVGKALLFDLDGTLLPMDTDAFVKEYMKAIAPHIGNHLDTETFLKVLWGGTREMITNLDPNLTNEQVFKAYFTKNTGIEEKEIWPVFDQFYQEHFPMLKEHTSPSNLSKEIIKIAKEQGRKIAVATNPVFPKAAIYERLKWLELDDYPFDHVTVYENSHFCKPNREYFQEILDRIGGIPEDTVMIGNDIQEDMVASQLGMKTFLVTDYLIDRGEPVYNIDQKGTLEELKQYIESKEGIFSF